MESIIENHKLTPLHNAILKQCIHFLKNTSFITGDKLPTERELALQFKTSRSSIRAVLKHLISKGILESKQGSGTYVAKPDIAPQLLSDSTIMLQDSSIYDQILEFRKVLEPAIAELAAEKCSQEQLNKLKVIVCDQQKRLIMDEGDGTLDAEFHLAIAESTGNALLVETVEKINKLYAEGRSDELRDKKWRQFSVSSHLRIIDAIEKKSKEECKKEVEAHLVSIHKNHIFFKQGE